MKSTRAPWATLTLIFVEIAIAFSVLFEPSVLDKFGFLPSAPTVHTALTSMFLHTNVIHLLGNMVFLAAVGPAVEFAAGSVRFLVVFFVSGLCGCAAHWIFFKHTDNLLVGASGAAAGLVAYASIRYWSYRVPIAPKIALPVATVVCVWIGLQILGIFIRLGDSGGGTALWAHVGGFLGGLLLSLVFRAPAMESLHTGHEILDAMNDRSPDARLAATERHLARHPEDVRTKLQKIEALAEIGDFDKEADYLIVTLNDGAMEEHWPHIIRRLSKINRLARVDPIKKLQFADKYRADEPEISRLMLRQFIAAQADDARLPDALLSLATLESQENPEESERLLHELANRFPLHPASELARARGLI